MEITPKTRKKAARLGMRGTIAVADFVRQKWTSFVDRPIHMSQAARWATSELGIEVSVSSLRDVLKAEGLEWPKAEPKRPAVAKRDEVESLRQEVQSLREVVERIAAELGVRDPEVVGG